MPQCEGCDSYVTPTFARVAGDNSGTVHECINCGRQHESKFGRRAGVHR